MVSPTVVAGEPAIRVDLLSGRVISRGADVRPSAGEAAVLFALCADDRPIGRDVLADMLYPDAEPEAAARSLKVCVHRARRRLGTPAAILYSDGLYMLGWCIDVDLPRLEASVRRSCAGSLTDDDRAILRDIRKRARGRLPNYVSSWPWFESTERRLRDLVYDATSIAAEDARLNGEFDTAVQLAGALLADDPLDENAAETVIRAAVQAGDRIGAALWYRRYSGALARELGERPTAALRGLFRDDSSFNPSRPEQPIVVP